MTEGEIIMHEVVDNKNNPPKKPFIFYAFFAVLIIMLLNIFVFPSMLKHSIVEVGYDQFLDMIDNGEVIEVSYDEYNGQFVFIGETDGRKMIYQTGIWPDDGQRLLQQLREHPEIAFKSEIPTQTNPLLSFILTWILPMAFFYIVGEIFYRQMRKKMGGQFPGGINAMSFGQSGAKIYVADEKTEVKFKDVAGQDEAKESLMEIVDFLHEPEKYSELGAKLPKGVLLVGSPGTGKTLLAKAVAGEAGVPFFSISGSEFVEMFVGMGAAKVRDLFKQANEKAPCIVFIDEIDAIGQKRNSGGRIGGNDEREQTLNQLLTEMDGFDGRKGVILLAATNRPEILDPALLRPGRFDRRVPVELPDLQGRKAILQVHAKKIKVDDSINWDIIARATAGASGAELANIINEAALRAVKENKKSVSQEDIEESVETVIAGAQRKNAVVSDKDKKIVAYHEIGHALVAAMQSNSAPVTKITIIPRTSGALGYTMQVDEGEQLLMSKIEILNKITTLTGGRSAEELIFGDDNITTGASNDIEQATRLARSMVTRFGMTDEFDMTAFEKVQNQYLSDEPVSNCADDTASRIDSRTIEIIKSAHKKAIEILKENENQLHKLAAYLLEKETITGEEFMKILNS